MDDELHQRMDDDTTGLLKDEGLGKRNWIVLIAVILGIGLAVMLTFVFISRAMLRYGFVGGFIVIGVILLLVGWWFDRREKRLRAGL